MYEIERAKRALSGGRREWTVSKSKNPPLAQYDRPLWT